MKKWSSILLMAVFMLSLCFILSLSAQEKKATEGDYTIKPGDTLWDISSTYLKDPFQWPKLWQRNPYITNPHWIYPGNSIRLSSMEELKKEEPKSPMVEMKPTEKVEKIERVVKVESPPVEAIEKKQEVVADIKAVAEKSANLSEIRSAGFISDIDYKGIGIILKNKEDKILMSEGDIIHLLLKTTDPISIGNKYTVIRASEIVRHPVSGKKVGRQYNIKGNVQVIDQHGSFYIAKVVEAFDAILTGDMIWPYSKEKMDIQERKK